VLFFFLLDVGDFKFCGEVVLEGEVLESILSYTTGSELVSGDIIGLTVDLDIDPAFGVVETSTSISFFSLSCSLPSTVRPIEAELSRRQL